MSQLALSASFEFLSYVMGLRPLEILYSLSAGLYFGHHQILTSKVFPILKCFIWVMSIFHGCAYLLLFALAIFHLQIIERKILLNNPADTC